MDADRRTPSPRRFASLPPAEKFRRFSTRFPKESAAFLEMMEIIWDTHGKLDRRNAGYDRRARRLAEASDRH
jgi:hypothetical protein